MYFDYVKQVDDNPSKFSMIVDIVLGLGMIVVGAAVIIGGLCFFGFLIWCFCF